MTIRDGTRIFEEMRAVLLGLAYRILGSRADAEDAVQDTFVKWQSAANKESIENPAAWLTAACTRRCIDLLRAAHRKRVDYVGPWLPEPMHTPVEEMSEERLALASSLSMAFLLLLERLTPKERAAYLLHEIFEVSYPQIAKTLGMEEGTCRKLVSRARTHIDQQKVRHVTPLERQDRLLAAFEAAIVSGTPEELSALLSDDIELCADGGGKVQAIEHILCGKHEVLEFLTEKLRAWWGDYQWVKVDINGGRGLVLQKNGTIEAAVSFAYDEIGRTSNIYIMRNPDKLARL